MRPRLERGRRGQRLRRDRGASLRKSMAIFKKPVLKSQNAKKRDIPQGLFQKCPGCADVVNEIELAQNQRVCPRCDYHMTQSAQERIQNLVDPDSFTEMDRDLRSVDTLRFHGMATYKDRLKKYQQSTGMVDAVITGHAMLDGYKIALAVMDFGFLAATMGSVVGERITRVIEFATAENATVIIVAASGGARMYEGMLSLMQMAKTSGALARHAEKCLPFISVLTNPTTAGVMASFASLGDVILAEPKSMIGFAGPRVIKETTHQDLPEGFQTAEFLQEHGLIDMIVHRKKMREQISKLLDYFLGDAVKAEAKKSSDGETPE
jgi:acetyl-CoA carboxylase carboxyl transferase subunit beta